MSRQRLRAGVLAGSTVTCPHCAGQGIIRSTESAALRLLRALDEEGQHQRAANLSVKAPPDVTIYTLNQKRREIQRIEETYDLLIAFDPQQTMMGGSFEIERTGTHTPSLKAPAPVSVEAGYQPEADEDVTLAEPPDGEIMDVDEPATTEPIGFSAFPGPDARIQFRKAPPPARRAWARWIAHAASAAASAAAPPTGAPPAAAPPAGATISAARNHHRRRPNRARTRSHRMPAPTVVNPMQCQTGAPGQPGQQFTQTQTQTGPRRQQTVATRNIADDEQRQRTAVTVTQSDAPPAPAEPRVSPNAPSSPQWSFTH